MSLYITINNPSPLLDKSPIGEAITFMAMQIAMEKRNGRLPQKGPALDVTFMLSTGDDAPPFKGMRMGGYSGDNNTLYFETAVPEAISHSGFATRYVTAVLQDVIEHASEFFAEQEIPFEAEHWSYAVNYLVEQEQSNERPH